MQLSVQHLRPSIINSPVEVHVKQVNAVSKRSVRLPVHVLNEDSGYLVVSVWVLGDFYDL